MYPNHRDAFFKAADKLNCWIGLREPNELSLDYIGKGGYTAKNEKCKAKSADDPAHQYKGLVVSPEICPEAFKPGSLSVAKEKWKLFAANMPFGFTVNKDGLVKYQGKSIHADFDLMYTTKADSNGKMMFTSSSDAKRLEIEVAKFINNLLGTEIIQHGAEMAWGGDFSDPKNPVPVGAKASEDIFSFGPKRQFRIDHSSMSADSAKWH
ncbi:MAG: hypothetical protein JST36_01850 [Bacteroidetes bacterium]|nr:hypothetical protein [Bacteroidota bacterium]